MFPDGVYPPNTLLIVDRLVQEPFLIEVQATAATVGLWRIDAQISSVSSCQGSSLRRSRSSRRSSTKPVASMTRM